MASNCAYRSANIYIVQCDKGEFANTYIEVIAKKSAEKVLHFLLDKQNEANKRLEREHFSLMKQPLIFDRKSIKVEPS